MAKIMITIKAPDCDITDDVRRAARESLGLYGLDDEFDLTEEENALLEERFDKYMEVVSRWTGEYTTLEVDTVANTAIVVPQ